MQTFNPGQYRQYRASSRSRYNQNYMVIVKTEQKTRRSLVYMEAVYIQLLSRRGLIGKLVE